MTFERLIAYCCKMGTLLRQPLIPIRSPDGIVERRQEGKETDGMGTRVTRAAAHLPAEEVKRRMQRDPRFGCRQRWLIIYQALIAPRKAEDIATHTGASLTT